MNNSQKCILELYILYKSIYFLSIVLQHNYISATNSNLISKRREEILIMVIQMALIVLISNQSIMINKGTL